MKRIGVDTIVKLQKQTSAIRNVCILAHVDHGKTTLADALVSSNGIISPKMAGKLRYMDSREDEQLKGITMKSSAISLYYQSDDSREYLVNLIDSPGHIDFYGEVSTVVRLCDGAIILVDVVEGVCPQTHAVIRQAWMQNIKPVLVLNKVDRLVLELKMTSEEAERRLMQILEQVNAITGILFTGEVLSESSKESHKENIDGNRDHFELNEWCTGLQDLDDSVLYFSPDQGNVVFSSAADGWGFRISKFASLYEKKLGVSAKVLNKTLWGDFYLDAKTKSVKKGAKGKGKKSLFVQLILDNIWKVYDCTCVKKDDTAIKKIADTLGVKVPSKLSDPKSVLHSILSNWLPLSSSVLEMICQLLPDPRNMSEKRLLKYLSGRSSLESVPSETLSLKEVFLKCSSSDEAPVVVFISKMFPFETKLLPKNRPKPKTIEELAARRDAILKMKLGMEAGPVNGDVTYQAPEVKITSIDEEKKPEDESSHSFIAFARIFSGTIKRGQWLYVFGPRHDPNLVKSLDFQSKTIDEDLKRLNVTKFQVNDLYLLMGRELESLEEVPAGNVLGIGGLEESVFRSASLSSHPFCPPFLDLFQEVSPIVRVAIEPISTANMNKLVHGLKLLNQSDPCIEIFVQDTGEHVLVTAGEVHLNKCLDDLKQRFAKIEIKVSAPTVPFRETIVLPPLVDRVNENIAGQISNSRQSNPEADAPTSVTMISDSGELTVRAVPLPEGARKILSEHSRLLKPFVKENSAEKQDCTFDEKLLADLDGLKEKLKESFSQESFDGHDIVDKIWSIDPKRDCTNILVNQISDYDRPSFWELAKCLDRSLEMRLRSLDRSIINGFQMVANSGPLCEEPMYGVCFVVEKWIEINKNIVEDVKNDSDGCSEKSVNDSDDFKKCPDREGNTDEVNKLFENLKIKEKVKAPVKFKGPLISCMKECCKRAFQLQPQRLMWAMYTCSIQATSDVLGRMYGVLGKRHGRILSEDLREGSDLFDVTAVLPVVESFGFAEEFRKKTSGLAMPQMKFSHWEVIEIDPFWVPTTEEEYAHFGEKADSENTARKHMNDVRHRKGLKTTEKLVEFGEKQRTLKKNK